MTSPLEIILAVDVYYKNNNAFIVGVAFSAWQDTEPAAIYNNTMVETEDYESGAFLDGSFRAS